MLVFDIFYITKLKFRHFVYNFMNMKHAYSFQCTCNTIRILRKLLYSYYFFLKQLKFLIIYMCIYIYTFIKSNVLNISQCIL